MEREVSARMISRRFDPKASGSAPSPASLVPIITSARLGLSSLASQSIGVSGRSHSVGAGVSQSPPLVGDGRLESSQAESSHDLVAALSRVNELPTAQGRSVMKASSLPARYQLIVRRRRLWLARLLGPHPAPCRKVGNHEFESPTFMNTWRRSPWDLPAAASEFTLESTSPFRRGWTVEEAVGELLPALSFVREASAAFSQVSRASITLAAAKVATFRFRRRVRARSRGSGCFKGEATVVAGDSSVTRTPPPVERRGLERPPFASVRL